MLMNQRRIFKSSGLTSAPTPEEARATLPRLDGEVVAEGKPCLVPINLIKPSPYQTTPLNMHKVQPSQDPNLHMKLNIYYLELLCDLNTLHLDGHLDI